mgnify:CR=1 FL=1
MIDYNGTDEYIQTFLEKEVDLDLPEHAKSWTIESSAEYEQDNVIKKSTKVKIQMEDGSNQEKEIEEKMQVWKQKII